ncbi:hypothetical protein IEU95_15110 [Hoyosella rhizosphaerae]|uniref:Membrane protein n=1 Tax=Hoyosella rhizosphaerae TaxID=1755582 RepID=A0A916UGU6_9ACTN|nr:hypothetical protein [Hoyosella rhizosphaerae]MBN4928165.1 hypothetical protein [Hoyosella rhizosphaerae]GGC72909.1 membrane protein [Hoyosella rhizosphaerae]
MTTPRDKPIHRERVILARRSGARPVNTRIELTEHTPVGDVLVDGLVTAQFRLALRLALLVIIGLGALPLVFVLSPEIASITIGGVLLPWLILGGVVYPLLFGIGWLFVRQAERNERLFIELVDE